MRTLLMLLAVLFIIATPLVLGGTFKGTDDQASLAIEQTHPGYKPWFTPLWQPPSSEIESLLFALQAAIGAGILGYVIGRKHGMAAKPDVTP